MTQEVELTRRINLSLLTQAHGSQERFARMIGYNSGHISNAIQGNYFLDYKVKDFEKGMGLPEGALDTELDASDIPDEVWKQVGELDPKIHDMTHIAHFANTFYEKYMTGEVKQKQTTKRNRSSGYKWGEKHRKNLESVREVEPSPVQQSIELDVIEDNRIEAIPVIASPAPVESAKEWLEGEKVKPMQEQVVETNTTAEEVDQDAISNAFKAAMFGLPEKSEDSTSETLTKTIFKAMTDASEAGVFSPLIEQVSESLAEAIVNRTAEKVMAKLASKVA